MKKILCAFLLVILLISSIQATYAGVFVSSGNVVKSGSGTSVYGEVVQFDTVSYSDIFNVTLFAQRLNYTGSSHTYIYFYIDRYTNGSWYRAGSFLLPNQTPSPSVSGTTVTFPPGTTQIRLLCDAIDGFGMPNINYTLTCAVGGYAASSAELTDAVTAANTASLNATNAYNAVYNANGNTVTAVRDSSGTVLAEARQAKTNASQASTNSLNAYNTAQTVSTKIDTLSSAITYIQNNMGVDFVPPSISIRTVSGAMATSGPNIQAVLNIADNISSTFTYSLNNIDYEPVPENKLIALPVLNSGSNVISVWVKDESGNIGTTSITIRKI
jgi:hypothetical protein